MPMTQASELAECLSMKALIRARVPLRRSPTAARPVVRSSAGAAMTATYAASTAATAAAGGPARVMSPMAPR